MKKLVIATNNPGKAKEFEKLFGAHGIEILTLADFPEIGEIEETGTTFSENAALKAETVSKKINQVVIGDDSGLIVDALNGAPGVYSARYAGNQHNDADNNEKLLKELTDVPASARQARFHCTLAIAFPGEETQFFTSECEGSILTAPQGENGFGYDPLFYLASFDKSMAEIPPEEKNKISHRAKALEKVAKNIDQLIEKIV
ncbi:XTP/dITP diphosphatase [Listeria booriae]|uniref:dITP/XTP pyrophosphatase n=1 Tax=Listeria booriae TaxID=1552123 RepID=A0A7X0ZVX7_9LIST|nr:XTP/dITP diphosphatase [Listeria booriae]MBC2284741.1 XTP/dITP diphosphatase [Listeria booriae]MBC2294234.1 XTP/dITP diphosphatase [Listeria booriae]MBC2303945.1 XTP/dITP diphosphatase [Listeria booriae]MBC2311199.1 XTP/dITP diphosphatase [Listeria booriae]